MLKKIIRHVRRIMPEFRDINVNNELEIKSHPIEKWRRPIKGFIPYYLGNTLNVEIIVNRINDDAPKLCRIHLFENTIEKEKEQMREWALFESEVIINSHTVRISRYLDAGDGREKRIGIQYDGNYEPLITVDILSKERARWNITWTIIIGIIVSIVAGMLLGLIEITPIINIGR